ncbi:MAG: hypothetical protein FWF86_00945 [Clostridia bacterium]|nr:hypothetical protein [Clostridia bacterium]
MRKKIMKRLLRPARNAYYRNIPRLRSLAGRDKRILLYANGDAMTSHIRRYCEPLLHEKTYRFFLYTHDSLKEDNPKNEFQQFIKDRGIPLCDRPQRHAWDLIVCADMRTPVSFTRDMTPILYVNHGPHIISMDGGETLYCYGEYARGEDGKPKFTKMCEANRMIMEAMAEEDPDMAAVMVHTGFKFAAEIERALQRREEYRRLLGITPNTCLVGLFGSWRENSLFHALGEGIFNVCESLRAYGYQFLFSIHPNEYTRYDPHIQPMGLLVDSQRERGMLVRDPREDYQPYMAACDIVISDFSAMAESAVLAGRKLIFSPYPDGMVWKRSLTAQARKRLPTLESPDGLKFLLDTVRREPVDPFILKAGIQLVREDHDQVMAALTRELLRISASAAGEAAR